MNCRRARQWISLEQDGRLEPHHVAALREHLERCDDCQAYRTDVGLGSRLLRATEPQLPETFDWALQLRLSQTLREAAGARSYPWIESERNWRSWWGRAGVSASVGLAAVLALAVLMPGQMAPQRGGRQPATEVAASPRLPLQSDGQADLLDPSRRPLEARFRGGLTGLAGSPGSALQRRVSGGLLTRDPWSGANDQDLLRIVRLEQDLEILRRRLAARDRTIRTLQTKLDSLTTRAVDNGMEPLGPR